MVNTYHKRRLVDRRIMFLLVFVVAGSCGLTTCLFKTGHHVRMGELEIIFSQDFENTTPGPYDPGEWARDWNDPGWNNGVKKHCTLVERDGTRAMRSYTPAGEWGLLGHDQDTMGGGFNWWAPVPGRRHDELYMSFNICFRPGVEFPISGKLPGLIGGPQGMDPGRAPEPGEGFTAYMAFYGAADPRGTLAFYCYHPDQHGDYGDLLVWTDPYNRDEPYFVVKENNVEEKWINLTIRVVLNSPEEKDGLLEGFVDGRLMYTKQGIRLRTTPSVHIDKCRMSWFYGGSGDDFSPRAEEWILIDDVTLFTYASDADVPHGNQPSPAGRTLDLPWMKGPTSGKFP